MSNLIALSEALFDEDSPETARYIRATALADSSEGKCKVDIGGGEVDILVAGSVKKDDVVAVLVQNGKVLGIGGVGFGDALVQKTAYIDDLTAKNITVENLVAANAYIQTLEAKNITVDNLTATSAYIDDLEAKNITADNIEATTAYIKNLTADDIKAGAITSNWLNSNYAHIKDGIIDNANIDWANINSANITDANITNATVGKLLANIGMVTSMTMQDGTITGELAAVTLNADTIKTGTLSVDRLILKGANGLYYAINADAGGLSKTELSKEQYKNALSGTALVAKSVTADKVSVSDLSAFNATIAGFTLTDSTMYSNSKSSVDSGAAGVYLGKDGSFAVGNTNNYLRFNASTGAFTQTLTNGYAKSSDVYTKTEIDSTADGLELSISKVRDNVSGLQTIIRASSAGVEVGTYKNSAYVNSRALLTSDGMIIKDASGNELAGYHADYADLAERSTTGYFTMAAKSIKFQANKNKTLGDGTTATLVDIEGADGLRIDGHELYYPVRLYYNATGKATGTITFDPPNSNDSKDIRDYLYFEIFYRISDSYMGSTKIFTGGSSNSFTVDANACLVGSASQTSYRVRCKTSWTLDSSTKKIYTGAIELSNNYSFTINADGTTATGSNRLYVYRIDGYRGTI